MSSRLTLQQTFSHTCQTFLSLTPSLSLQMLTSPVSSSVSHYRSFFPKTKSRVCLGRVRLCRQSPPLSQGTCRLSMERPPSLQRAQALMFPTISMLSQTPPPSFSKRWTLCPPPPRLSDECPSVLRSLKCLTSSEKQSTIWTRRASRQRGYFGSQEQRQE